MLNQDSPHQGGVGYLYSSLAPAGGSIASVVYTSSKGGSGGHIGHKGKPPEPQYVM